MLWKCVNAKYLSARICTCYLLYITYSVFKISCCCANIQTTSHYIFGEGLAHFLFYNKIYLNDTLYTNYRIVHIIRFILCMFRHYKLRSVSRRRFKRLSLEFVDDPKNWQVELQHLCFQLNWKWGDQKIKFTLKNRKQWQMLFWGRLHSTKTCCDGADVYVVF